MPWLRHLRSTAVSLPQKNNPTSDTVAPCLRLATQDYLTWGGVLLVYGPFVFVIAWLIIFRNVPSRLRR